MSLGRHRGPGRRQYHQDHWSRNPRKENGRTFDWAALLPYSRLLCAFSSRHRGPLDFGLCNIPYALGNTLSIPIAGLWAPNMSLSPGGWVPFWWSKGQLRAGHADTSRFWENVHWWRKPSFLHSMAQDYTFALAFNDNPFMGKHSFWNIVFSQNI